ncbi:hypothetical protein H9V85_004953 [Salmonella enterica subsp. enterica serovar Louisiana]|nr:hypothetical protein [Salmonella enterica]EBG0215823.1 hypothetical protein [Salmonella enterica subsp. enterica serovar Louisiana]ECA5251839.1 hypothetical protein [Salmonella enterica subsp. enterica serovar Lomalinda]ECB5045739.1 hypothetical protein [Salmonella enterica subsp. enterica serovar Teshie]ECD3930697.1 hypothetical protein [Salmonella enterica subsp. enterica serovar Wangata]ECJ4938476.1 hypothetical protein [Salmonella enterica subsp. enterica]EDL3488619.1 hypothetical prot
MVFKAFKAPVIWGVVCFLLLYPTFPTELNVWWEALQQWDIPVWQQIVTWSSGILPALIPLGIMLMLQVRRPRCSKNYTIIIPFVAWLIGRSVLVVILWVITFKISNEPPYSGGFQNIIVNQIVMMFWNLHTLVSALIIITCSYAFWRECSFQEG